MPPSPRQRNNPRRDPEERPPEPREAPAEFESYSIRARISIQDLWPCILKSGDMFALFNRIGDVPPACATPGGIFYNDTRHLSQLDVLLNGHMPLLLSA